MFTKRSLPNESGQALIQMMLAMVVIMVIMALAIDVGSLYAERRKMQNAADAGAMAGAMVLCRDGEAAARTAALSIAQANGAQNITIDPPANGVMSVTVSTTAQSSFARILSASFATNTVRAMATAKCGPVSTIGSGFFPIAVKESTTTAGGGICVFGLGATCNLLDNNAPGNFGWLSWDGSNSSGYLAGEINDARTGAVLQMISVDDWVQGLPGNKVNANSVKEALAQLAGKTITIVVYGNKVGSGSNLEYEVVGFAEFTLGTVTNGNLTGTFVAMVTASTSTEGGTDFGVYGSRLTQ